MKTLELFNQKREKIAFIQNAFEVGYYKGLNELWSASFSVPANDPKNVYCEPFNYVRIYDGAEDIGLFRIIGIDLEKSDVKQYSYNCEHVLATLIDDVLFRYHQIGNIGIFTTQVINYVLNRQTTRNWVLGACDFERQFEYKWENENLLAALFSIPKPFEFYRWEYDTSGYPWVVRLKTLSGEVKSELRYAKNLTTIKKTVDATKVITRIYALGYGEGDNQLGIESVNNGVPYIDAPTITTYGLKQTILADRRFEDAESLKAYAQKILDGAQDPYITYEVNGVDLFGLTGQSYDKFNVGDMLKVVDSDAIFNAPIISIAKTDIGTDPLNVKLVIANKAQNLSGSINQLQERANINDLYAQGATNQLIVSFADNADLTHPAVLRLFVPDTMVRINSCVLNFEFRPFRAYEKGVDSTAQTVYSTSSTPSTYSSSSTEATQTQSTSTDSSKIASTSTDSAKYTSTSSGGGAQPTSSAVTLLPQNIQDSSNGGYGAANHNHGVGSGTQLITSVNLSGSKENGYTLNYSSVGWVPSGAHIHEGHTHTVNIPTHAHDVTIPSHGHTVTIPSHNHTVTIPGHSHYVDIPGHSHSVTIPAHTHPMQYGIFEGNTAQAGRLYVNGKYKIEVAPYTDYNIAAYLADPKTGTIDRNTFHRIEIYPVAANGNAQALTGISANIFLQIFTNSRGQGDF